MYFKISHLTPKSCGGHRRMDDFLWLCCSIKINVSNFNFAKS